MDIYQQIQGQKEAIGKDVLVKLALLELMHITPDPVRVTRKDVNELLYEYELRIEAKSKTLKGLEGQVPRFMVAS